jgi:hypothetical protein
MELSTATNAKAARLTVCSGAVMLLTKLGKPLVIAGLQLREESKSFGPYALFYTLLILMHGIAK